MRSIQIAIALVLVPASIVLAGEHSPDPNRLLRARLLIDVDTPASQLGSYALYTDVQDQELLERLAKIATNLPSAYEKRFHLDPGPVDGEVIVLYKAEKAYRTFETAEPSVANARTDGFATRGLIVLYVGDQDDFILDVMLVHELTHLLNRRVFGLDIPTWLDEGLATEMAISKLDPSDLTVRLGTLNGEDPYQSSALIEMRAFDPVSAANIGINRPVYRDLKGGVAALTELGVVWDLPTRPSMSEVLSMTDREFIAPGKRGVHYAMSAFLIRYFLEAGKKGQTNLYRYLQATASEGQLPDPSPWSYMDMKEGKFENRFRVWLRNQLFAAHIRPVYTALLVDPTPYVGSAYGNGSGSGTPPTRGESSAAGAGGAASSGGGGSGTPGPPPSKGQIKN